MIHLVDRQDQTKWLVGKDWQSFRIKVTDNEFEIYNWLEENTKHRVVISGDGSIPPPGGMYHPTGMIFKNIVSHLYQIFFEDEAEAVLFKLTWGGSL